jgi:DNA-binding NtrC family response regulator
VTTEDLSFRPDELPEDRSLMIVDDDKAFLQRLARAMELRGFEVRAAHSVAEGVDMVRQKAPAFAIVDMRLEDGNGLDFIAELTRIRPNARIIVLTGYGNIATAVSTISQSRLMLTTSPTHCWRRQTAKRRRPKIQCRRIVCAGSISSAFMNSAIATFQKPHAA